MNVRPQEFESRTPPSRAGIRTVNRQGDTGRGSAKDKGTWACPRCEGLEVGHEARRASRTDADAGRRMEQARLAGIPAATRRGHGRVLAGAAGTDSRPA